MSSNTALTRLICFRNNLSSLNVSSNPALTYLGCDRNNLSSLDVSSNTALTYLYCHQNSLSSLDVSSNTALEVLDCDSNSLTSLDVSSNTALTRLYCNNNSLTSLDVSSNTALYNLNCNSNSLTSLDVSNGNNNNPFDQFSLNAKVNPNLTCIQVDDVAYSDANWSSFKDVTANYSLGCIPLNTEAAEAIKYQLYPNPVKDVLNIVLNPGLELKQVTIYSTLGQFINTTKKLKIDTSNLKSGIYFVEVETTQGKSAKKIVIE